MERRWRPPLFSAELADVVVTRRGGIGRWPEARDRLPIPPLGVQGDVLCTGSEGYHSWEGGVRRKRTGWSRAFAPRRRGRCWVRKRVTSRSSCAAHSPPRSCILHCAFIDSL